MKKTILCYAATLFLIFGFTNTSLALNIDNAGGNYDGVNVGSLDNLESVAEKVPGEAAEEFWVNWALGTLGTTVDDNKFKFTTKAETVSYYATNGTNIYALSLQGTPDYFLLKNAQWMALYENVGELSWAVFDSSLLPQDYTGEDGKIVKGMNVPSDVYTISHVSEFNDPNDPGDTPTPTPEPGTMVLLGTGLLGLGLVSRRKKNK